MRCASHVCACELRWNISVLLHGRAHACFLVHASFGVREIIKLSRGMKVQVCVPVRASLCIGAYVLHASFGVREIIN